MKNVKQFLAVFLTAVFIAGSFPVSLSAADTSGKGSEVSVEADMAAADTDQQADTENDPDGPAEQVREAAQETYEEADPETNADTEAEAAADASADDFSETSAEASEESGIEKDSRTESGSENIRSQEDSAGAGTDAAAEAGSIPAENGPDSVDRAETPSSSGNSPRGEEPAAVPAGKAPQEELVSTPAVMAAEAGYTVTLNANGGGYYIDYSNQNARVQTVTHTGEPEGMDISVYQIPRANPGKIFAGWSTSANGTVLPTGTTVTKDLYLYAIWEQGCAVTLDANGGHFTLEDGSQSSSVMATVAKGDRIFSYSFVGSGEPEADGKRLKGYGRMVNGTITLLPSTGGTGYTFTEESLTLYAVWINVCEITYDANGGGYFTGLIDETIHSTTYTETLDEGETVYNMNFINLVANDGCTFLGWSLKADGTEVLSSSGYTVSAGALTLYAVWDGTPSTGPDPDTPDPDDPDPDVPGETETCTITYDANGGNFPRAGRVRPTIKTFEKAKGSKVSLLDPENYGGTDPSRTHCTFMGWSFAADSIELITEEESAQFVLTKDITLYAVWTTTITFDANGGSFKSGEIITDTIFPGTTVNLGNYEIPTRAGFVFSGWAENDFTANTVSTLYPVDADDDNPFLYAVWVRDIKAAKITLSKTQTPYTGAAQKPAVTVIYGDPGEKLTEGTDYTLTYSNNMNAGTASVVVRGIAGKLAGSVTKTFTITRIAQKLSLTASSLSVTAKKTVKVTAGGAKETTKYSFTSSNKAVATVTASGAAGTVTGVKGGRVSITVTTPQTTNYLKGTKTLSIIVIPENPKNCRFVKWQKSNYSKCLIAWNPSAGATGYQTVLSWTNGTHAATTNLKSSILQQSCYVPVNRISQFKVRAYIDTAAGRKYSAWSNVAYITPSPTKLTVKKVNASSSKRKAKISWKIINGCSGYNVYVTTNPNGKWYLNQSTKTSAKYTSAVISKFRGAKLKKKKTYYVRIVSRRKMNGVFYKVPVPAKNTYTGKIRF